MGSDLGCGSFMQPEGLVAGCGSFSGDATLSKSVLEILCPLVAELVAIAYLNPGETAWFAYGLYRGRA